MSKLFKKSPLSSSDFDPVIAKDEQRIHDQKKHAFELHQALRVYSDSYRKCVQTRASLFAVFRKLYDDSWSDKEAFEERLTTAENLAEKAVANVSKQTIERVLLYRDSFNQVENEIREYKHKSKQYKSCKSKLKTAIKKNPDKQETISKLQNDVEEKRVPLDHAIQKLRIGLPKFYDSRMDVYSDIWSSFFLVHSESAKEEADDMAALLHITKNFILERQEGVYDTEALNVDFVSEASLDLTNAGYADLDDDDSQYASVAKVRSANSLNAVPTIPDKKLTVPSKPKKPQHLSVILSSPLNSSSQSRVLVPFQGSGSGELTVQLNEIVERVGSPIAFDDGGSWILCRKQDCSEGYLPFWCINAE